MSVRLNKLLAERGLGARRKCDALIESGVVRVNGQVVRELGTQVEPDRDRIEVDGKPIPRAVAHRTFVLNKPVGVISTLSDPEGRRSLADFMPPGTRLFPVGRLDADTSGLLLLTNDGELAHHLMHPRYGVAKRYRVHVDRAPSESALRRLQEGIEFEPGVVSAPAQVWVRDADGDEAVIEMALHEGRHRQVRHMCEAAGLEVKRLHRWGYGPLRLGQLERGMWRELSEQEIADLRAASARPQSREGGGRRATGQRSFERPHSRPRRETPASERDFTPERPRRDAPPRPRGSAPRRGPARRPDSAPRPRDSAPPRRGPARRSESAPRFRDSAPARRERPGRPDRGGERRERGTTFRSRDESRGFRPRAEGRSPRRESRFESREERFGSRSEGRPRRDGGPIGRGGPRRDDRPRPAGRSRTGSRPPGRGPARAEGRFEPRGDRRPPRTGFARDRFEPRERSRFEPRERSRFEPRERSRFEPRERSRSPRSGGFPRPERPARPPRRGGERPFRSRSEFGPGPGFGSERPLRGRGARPERGGFPPVRERGGTSGRPARRGEFRPRRGPGGPPPSGRRPGRKPRP